MKRIIKFVSIFLLAITANIALAADSQVGTVIFTIGASNSSNDVQAFEPVSKGQSIKVGQTIKTEQNGHVHIRFVDNAFVSIRPNSTLVVEDYFVDDANPKNNRIKFSLKQGTSRLITGKGGHDNKEAFRLNTPVAAIGVRGTDFVVNTDVNVTRVSVQQGGVAISPFNSDCGVSSYGPCKGDLVRDLMGSVSNSYLEVRGQMAAELITPVRGKLPFALPRPEEPAVIKKAESQSGLARLGDNNTFMWGRWAGSTATPAGYELIGQNEAFALFRLTEQPVLPNTAGFIDFFLTDSAAYGKRGDGEFMKASIQDAKFSVNFERREFATRFNWVFENDVKELFSRGSIANDGKFVDNPSTSNISLSGAMSNNGDSAAYIFSQRFSAEDLRAYGILRWTK